MEETLSSLSTPRSDIRNLQSWRVANDPITPDSKKELKLRASTKNESKSTNTNAPSSNPFSSKSDAASSVNDRTNMRRQFWNFLWLQFNQSVDAIYARCEQESFIPQCQEVINTLKATLSDFEKLLERLRVQEPVQKQLEEVCDSNSSAKSKSRLPSLVWEVRKSSPMDDSILFSHLQPRSQINLMPSHSASVITTPTKSPMKDSNKNSGSRRASFSETFILDQGTSLLGATTPMIPAETPRSVSMSVFEDPDEYITISSARPAEPNWTNVTRKDRDHAHRLQAADNNRKQILSRKQMMSKNHHNKVKNIIHRQKESLILKKQVINQQLEKAETLHEIHIKQIQQKAANENEKVSEVAFINQIGNEILKVDLANRLEKSSRRRQDSLNQRSQKFQTVHAAKNEAAVQRRKALEEELKQKALLHEKKMEESEKRRQERLLSISSPKSSPTLSAISSNVKPALIELKKSEPTKRATNRSLLKQLEQDNNQISVEQIMAAASSVKTGSKIIELPSQLKQRALNEVSEIGIKFKGSCSPDIRNLEHISVHYFELSRIFANVEALGLCLREKEMCTLLISNSLNYFNSFLQISREGQLIASISGCIREILKILKLICSFSGYFRHYFLSESRLIPLIELLKLELTNIDSTNICHSNNSIIPSTTPTIHSEYTSNASNLLSIVSMVLLEPVPAKFAESSKYVLFKYINDGCLISRVNDLFHTSNSLILNGNALTVDGPLLQLILQILQFLEAITTYADVQMSSKPVYERTKSANLNFDNANTTQNISISTMLSLMTAISLEFEQKLGWTSKHTPDQQKNGQKFEIPDIVLRIVMSVLMILNNVARLDLSTLQSFDPDGLFRGELYHFLSMWLRYTTIHFELSRTSRVLLHQLLLFMGYFSLQNDKNQETFRWGGQVPTLLNRLCNLPFCFFSDSKKKDVLFPTLISICFQCAPNKFILVDDLNLCFLTNYIEEQIATLSVTNNLLSNESKSVEESGVAPIVESDAVVVHGDDSLENLFQFKNRFPITLWTEALNYFQSKLL